MRGKILLIDDEQRVLDSLKRSLPAENYDVLIANSSQKAIRIIEEEEVDIVISDHDMPNLNGTELLSIFRTSYPNTIRIILTGKGDYETAIQSINSGGVYSFLTKPCSTEQLETVIQRALLERKFLVTTSKLLYLARKQKAQLEAINHTDADSSDSSSSTNPFGGKERERQDSSFSALYLNKGELGIQTLIKEIEKELGS